MNDYTTQSQRLPLFLELSRRILVGALLFAGLWSLCLRGGPYLIVERVDFEADYRKSPYFKGAHASVESFRRQRTEGRMREVAGTAAARWMQNTLHDESPDSLQKIEGRRGNSKWVFRPDSIPGIPPPNKDTVLYLKGDNPNDWLVLTCVPAGRIPGLSGNLNHPTRLRGLLLLVASVLLYILIPRRKEDHSDLSYARAASVVIPDFLGFGMASFFFVLGLLVLNENQPGVLPWQADGGWAGGMAVLGIIMVLSLSIPLIAAHYSCFRIRLEPDALALVSRGRVRRYTWSEMATCGPYEGRAAGRLGLLLLIFARGPGMMGQALLVAGNREHGVEIRMRDGHTFRIMANSLPGFDKILHALKTHSVPGAAGIGKA